MKRTSYDAEYDRVMRQAKMANPEFYDPDEPPDARLAARIQAAADDTIAELTQQPAQPASPLQIKTEADMADLRRRTNERLRLASWARYGIEPPSPEACLELYLSLGWRLEHTAEGWKLFKPVPHTPRSTQPNEMGS